MNRDASFELRCVIKHETDDAVLIEVEDAGEAVWLPLSQIESHPSRPRSRRHRHDALDCGGERPAVIDRPLIGSVVDHDLRHYQFQRTTGLPRGTFDRGPQIRWRWVLLAAFAVLLGLWGTSVAMSDEEITASFASMHR